MKRLCCLLTAALCACTLFSCSAKEDKTSLALDVSKKLDAGVYQIDMIIKEDNAEQMPCVIKANGSDGTICMDEGGIYTEIYTVDLKTYVLFPEVECYQLTADEGAFGNALFKITEGDKEVSSKTEDGKITEEYTSQGGSYTFVFDSEDKSLESFSSDADGRHIDITVNSLTFNDEKITLPDISGWADISGSASVDEVTAMKFSLYTQGITADMLSGAGYTIEEFVKLPYDEQQSVIAQILSGASQSKAD